MHLKINKDRICKFALCIIVLFIIAVSIVSRLYIILNKGGFSEDYLSWSNENYYGGITQVYLYMKDLLHKGNYENNIFSYLPGYPIFLNLLGFFEFNSLFEIRVAQSIIDSFAIIPLFYVIATISRSHFGALLGCCIYAVSPWLAAGSTFILAEGLLPALLISFIAALVAIRNHPQKNSIGLRSDCFQQSFHFFARRWFSCSYRLSFGRF